MTTHEMVALVLSLYPDDMPPLTVFAVTDGPYYIEVILGLNIEGTVWVGPNVLTGTKMFDKIDLVAYRGQTADIVRIFLAKFRREYLKATTSA